jgi:hypothetical protein
MGLKGRNGSTLATQLVMLAKAKNGKVVVEARANGSLILRPTVITSGEWGLFFSSGLFAVTDHLLVEHVAEQSDRSWMQWFTNRYAIGSGYEDRFPLTSLRPFAQALMHAFLLQRATCKETLVCDVALAIDSYVKNELPAIEADGKMKMCWLWSGEYGRNEFVTLLKKYPDWRWFAVNRDLRLSPATEVGLDVFQERRALWPLILLLATNIAGVKTVPHCVCFKENANLVWYLGRTQARLLTILGGVEYDDNYSWSMLFESQDNFSAICLDLLKLDMQLLHSFYNLNIGDYLALLFGVVSKINSVLARLACRGELMNWVGDVKYRNFLLLSYQILKRHCCLTNIA